MDAAHRGEVERAASTPPVIEDGRLAEHWGVIQDEATAAESKSGLPMIGDRFLIVW